MIVFGEHKPVDVIALGRAGIDMNAVDMHLPMEKNMVFRKTVGGSPANIATSCARYGLSVGFIGRVSDDQHGRYIRSFFTENGIDTTCLITDDLGGMNGLAFTEIQAQQSSYILHRDNVADLNLSVSDIDEGYIGQSKLLVISGTALSRGPSRESVFAALHYAREHQTRVMLDIDYRNYCWKSVEESSVYLTLAAEMSDIVIGTRDEYDMLEKNYRGGNTDDARTAASLLSREPQIVIIKHGVAGSVAFTADEVVQGAVFPVDPLKTMGAGDAYAGALIFGLLAKTSLKEAMRLGAAAAAIVVQRPDCSESMPSIEEVHEFLSTYVREV